MRRSPVPLLVSVTLALCAVCFAQWRREAALRHRLVTTQAQLTSETAAHQETTSQGRALESEITRLSQLRTDTETKLIEVTDALTEAQARLTQSADTAAQHAQLVQSHNTTLAEANARLQSLTAERDQAVEELNQRTRAYNDLRSRLPPPRP